MPDASRHFDETVALLYDAVLDDDVWTDLYGRVEAATGAAGFHLAVIDNATTDPRTTFSRLHIEGAPAPELEDLYLRDYFAQDERIPRLPQLPDTTLIHNDSLLTASERRNSAVYNDFLGRMGGTNQVLTRLPSRESGGGRQFEGDDGDYWILTKYHAGEWSTDQVQFIERLMPHMGRFLTLRRGLARAQAIGLAAAKMLDGSHAAAALLDQRGRIIECNARAQSLIRQGDFTSKAGVLRPAGHGSRKAFARALSEALPRLDSPATGSTVRIPRNGGLAMQRHLLAHFVPVAADLADFAALGCTVLLIVIDPWQAPELDMERITQALGLTESEAQVSALLAQGHSVSEIAEKIHRTRETVRFHLKQAYAKTGARGQAELVRMTLAAG